MSGKQQRRGAMLAPRPCGSLSSAYHPIVRSCPRDFLIPDFLSHWPAEIVNVTVRVPGATAAVAVALSVYTIGSALALTEEMPVTTSADAVLNVIDPVLDAPLGALSATASETPEGIG